MPLPQTREILPFPFLSQLLDLTFHTRNLKATSSIHAHLIRTGFLANLNLHTKLLLSYAAATAVAGCRNSFLDVGNLLRSMETIDNDPSRWNSILSTFARHGFPSLAVRTFHLMHGIGITSDTYTLCSVLAASASTTSVEFGKQVHAHVLKSGCMSSVFVGGPLIDMYAKSCVIRDACEVFVEMPFKNTVCANALVAGYSEMKLWDEGLALVRRMSALNLEPDGFTLSTVLRMCAELPAAGLGMQVHAHLVRRIHCFEQDLVVQSSLVEMYGKCGLAEKARLVFDLIRKMAGESKRDVVLWTSMLNAYSRNGWFDNVIATFEEMLVEGTKLDEIAFVSVLSACSRIGQVVRGLEYFESMVRDYRISPWPEHYGCVMDLLCRAGELDRAWKFANEMASRSDGSDSSSVWGALLSACKDCGNVGMGKAAAQRALELDPGNVGIYVELSNLYARMGMWAEIGELRELMKGMGLKKDVGSSWLELTSSS